MNPRYLLISLFLTCSLSSAFTDADYKELCQGVALSKQGKRICQKHALRMKKNKAVTHTPEATPSTAKALTFKEQRIIKRTEAPKFKPYVPGGYAQKAGEAQ